MAIDKNRTRELIDQIDRLFDSELVGNVVPQAFLDTIKEKAMGPAIAELRRLVDEARPPVFYLVGRTKHGKSSVINALAGKDVAPVGDKALPCTVMATPYLIQFPEQYAEWKVIDSRGLFETIPPAGAAASDALTVATADILEHRPDVILHVVNALEVGGLANDLKAMQQVQEAVKQQTGSPLPILVVLTHVDCLGDVGEWPPEAHAEKQAKLTDHVTTMAKDAAGAGSDYGSIEGLPLFRGCAITRRGCPFLYVIPVNVPQKPTRRWNVDTLVDVISGQLPGSAQLLFFQALRRKDKLRNLASSMISRFTVIAGSIGATPVPVADILLLTPLQMVMVAIIAGLSCREMSVKTASEYATACGVSVGVGLVLREVFRQALKLFPIAGNVGAGVIAAKGTYALGKSAEAYFFAGEIHSPEEFKDEADQQVSS